MNQKRCTKCGTMKPALDFRARKSAKDGLTSWCRACLNAAALNCVKRRYRDDPEYRARHNAKSAERQKRPDIRKQRRVHMKEYCARPEVKERAAKRSREWVEANPERALENHRRWVEENREKTREYSRRFYASEKGLELHRLQQSKRRARMKGVGHDLTRLEWEKILFVWGGLCAYCGGPGETVEHVVPIARGGGHTRSNVVPACNDCNFRKNGRVLDEFLAHAEATKFRSRHVDKLTRLSLVPDDVRVERLPRPRRIFRKVPNAKLTQEQADDIRRRYAAGEVSQQALADEYGVSQVVVSRVVRGEGWNRT